MEKEVFLEHIRRKYQTADRKKKGEYLREIEEVLGIGYRQSLRLVKSRRVGRPVKARRPGRPSKYKNAEFRRSLLELWRIRDYPCSAVMKADMQEWIEGMEEAYKRQYPSEIRKLLLSASKATIDRVLKPYRVSHGISTTRSGGFRKEIPIQKDAWLTESPGFVEVDTVAHCGENTSGEYVSSLTVVDIATLWTEVRGIYGKGSTTVVQAFEDIENVLPFELLGYDSDNGTEVLNRLMYTYLTKEREERGRKIVQVTRSRAYHSNDNAHVEQRNDTIVRKTLGYKRFEHQEIAQLIFYLYKYIVCPLSNHFYSVYKLKNKLYTSRRSKRIYGKPETPYSRVVASPMIPDTAKRHLIKLHESLNPVKLVKMKRNILRQIVELQRALQSGFVPRRLLEIPPPPQEMVEYEKLIREEFFRNVESLPIHKARK